MLMLAVMNHGANFFLHCGNYNLWPIVTTNTNYSYTNRMLKGLPLLTWLACLKGCYFTHHCDIYFAYFLAELVRWTLTPIKNRHKNTKTEIKTNLTHTNKQNGRNTKKHTKPLNILLDFITFGQIQFGAPMKKILFFKILAPRAP